MRQDSWGHICLEDKGLPDECLYKPRILALGDSAATSRTQTFRRRICSPFKIQSHQKWLLLTWKTFSFTTSPQSGSRGMHCRIKTISELLLSPTPVTSQHHCATKQIRHLSAMVIQCGQPELLDAKGMTWHSSTKMIQSERRVESVSFMDELS